jgi:ketosteroid isomerase-like protein
MIEVRVMQTIRRFKLVILATCLVFSSSAVAQEVANDQADVWSVIEQQWDAVEKGDKKWIDRFLADDFSGWPKNSPAPRSKTSTQMWDRFNNTQGNVVAHELYPLAIIVHGDVAVAHYLFTSAYKDKDGDVEVDNGRFSDILIRVEDGWRFLSWHGGNDE